MELSSAQISQIVENASWSPSGDNCQPWTFEWDGKKLSIFYDEDRGRHPLNPAQTASMLSLGCVLSAIELTASKLHLSSQFSLINDFGSEKNPWAQVQFQPTKQEPSPLSEFIHQRMTNRRLYKGGSINRETFEEVLNQGLYFEPAKFSILSNLSRALIDYIVEADAYLMDEPGVLSNTLKWTHLTAKKALESKDGMLWRNMEVKIWELPLIPILRDFPSSINFLGFAMKPQNRIRIRRQLSSSAGLVCVTIPRGEIKNLVHAGRLMMWIWLSLTRLGYGVQPFTIASTVAYCARRGLLKVPQKWLKLFTEGESILRQEFSIPIEDELVWLVRTGLSDPLPENARTFRLPVERILKFKT